MSAGGVYFLSSFVADDGFNRRVHEDVAKAEDTVFGARFEGAAWVRVVFDEVYSGVKAGNQIDELRYIVNRWRMDYNHYRPHSSLDLSTKILGNICELPGYITSRKRW